MHAFAAAIVAAMPLPFVSMIGETARTLRQQHRSVMRVGVLAVEGTARAQRHERALVPGPDDVAVPLLDATGVLARCIVAHARGALLPA